VQAALNKIWPKPHGCSKENFLTVSFHHDIQICNNPFNKTCTAIDYSLQTAVVKRYRLSVQSRELMTYHLKQIVFADKIMKEKHWNNLSIAIG